MRTLLLLATLALCPAATPFAPLDDLADQLDEITFRLESADGADTWELAQELRKAARSDSVVAVPRLVATAQDSSPAVRLVLADTLIDLDASGEAADVLLPMVEGEHAPAALAALADQTFRDVPKVAKALSEMLEAPLEANRRIDVARTLYQVSRSKDRFVARRILLDTLKSDSPETRAMGALALAEIKDYESARPVLRVLSSDPGPRGQLARAYLETADKIDYYLEKLFRQSEQGPTSSARTGDERGGVGSLDVLDELMQKIIDNHLVGEKLDDPDGRERLITAAARGMLQSLDPHSTYFSPKEYERWILDLRRNYAGIGAYVDTVDDVFTITRPIYSGPAYRAGLMTGDRIIEVDGWDTRGRSNDDIIKRLKGEPETEVTVTVHRTGWTEFEKYVIKREVIHIPSVQWEMLPGNIGLVEILSFAEETADELSHAIEALASAGMEGMLLDLRNNSGGYLEEAVKTASVFIEEDRLVVSTKGRGVQQRDYHARIQSLRYDGPLVMLVNERSASASEIVAGALQDHGRAIVVGEKTFGKGSVQQAHALEARPGDTLTTDKNYDGAYDPDDQYIDLDGDGVFTYRAYVKITNARYYLPSGRSIHTELDFDGRVVEDGGVTPDVLVEYGGGLQGWENYELAQLYNELRTEYDQAKEQAPDSTEPFRDPFERYVEEIFQADPDLIFALADGDDRDTSRYPGFDAFRASLDTPLPDETVRLWLRNKWVRDKVADVRGRAFPGQFAYGDWQEDLQLQEAIRQLAPTMALDMTAHESYAPFADADTPR